MFVLIVKYYSLNMLNYEGSYHYTIYSTILYIIVINVIFVGIVMIACFYVFYHKGVLGIMKYVS